MNKSDVVKRILGARYLQAPTHISAKAFAPTNIALCKYWGKRDQELNLPVTASLSISLGNKGAVAEFNVTDTNKDSIYLNKQEVPADKPFAQRLKIFLNLFRPDHGPYFLINITSNIPIAAGLASSACGFASVVQALNNLYAWDLSDRELSILSRLGSGSASRSIWQGFVEWHAGTSVDGMDSYGEPLPQTWPELCVGLLIMSQQEKKISSRVAMQRTVETSSLYDVWPHKVAADMLMLKQAIKEKDFHLLGKTAESNAMTMHATMLSAWPPVSYAIPETVLAMQKIWQLREAGLAVYFTQDAGPNLKLLFLQQDLALLKDHFPEMEVVHIFDR